MKCGYFCAFNIERHNGFCDVCSQVVQRIKAIELETRLLVVDRETDEYLRSLRLTCTEDMAVQVRPSASSSSPPPTPNKRDKNSVSKMPSGHEIPKPSRRSPSRANKKVHEATAFIFMQLIVFTDVSIVGWCWVIPHLWWRYVPMIRNDDYIVNWKSQAMV